MKYDSQVDLVTNSSTSIISVPVETQLQRLEQFLAGDTKLGMYPTVDYIPPSCREVAKRYDFLVTTEEYWGSDHSLLPIEEALKKADITELSAFTREFLALDVDETISANIIAVVDGHYHQGLTYILNTLTETWESYG